MKKFLALVPVLWYTVDRGAIVEGFFKVIATKEDDAIGLGLVKRIKAQ